MFDVIRFVLQDKSDGLVSMWLQAWRWVLDAAVIISVRTTRPEMTQYKEERSRVKRR